MTSRRWRSTIESTIDLQVVASSLALSMAGWICRHEFTIDKPWVLLAALPPQVLMYFTVQHRRARNEPILACVIATEVLVFAAAATAAVAPSS